MNNFLNLSSQLSFVIIALCFFASCGPDDEVINPCENVVCLNFSTCESGVCDCITGYTGDSCEQRLYLLRRIKLDGNLYYTLEYDEENRLMRKYRGNANNPLYDFKYSYGQDSIEVEIIIPSGDTIFHFYVESPDGSQLDFSYEDNQTPKSLLRRYKDKEGECGYLKGEGFIPDNSMPTQRLDITYSGDCNVMVETFSETTNDLMSTTEVTLADGGFFHQQEFLYRNDNELDFLTSKKRITKIIITGSGVGADFRSYESVFTLNSAGFPATEKRSYLDGRSEFYEFEYY